MRLGMMPTMTLNSTRRLVVLGCTCLTLFPGLALATPSGERQAILDAVRPLAAAQARQPVRIVVQRLNRTSSWAVLEGSLVDAKGADLNWALAKECEPELDKNLWAVLRRDGAGWRVLRLEICAPEPPYWSADNLRGLALPCAVLTGLQSAEGADLGEQCRRTSLPASSRPLTEPSPTHAKVKP